MTISAPPKPVERLLLGITGAIAAAWMPGHVLTLRACFAERIDVLLSRTAARFVSALALRQISGQRVHMDHHDHCDVHGVPHIELPRDADLFLVAPATASILGRCAYGLCDDLVSTAVIATPPHVPVVFVPSMNERMWDHPVVRHNVMRLRQQGHHVIEPQRGYEVATMAPSRGAMPPLADICANLTRIVVEHAARHSERRP